MAVGINDRSSDRYTGSSRPIAKGSRRYRVSGKVNRPQPESDTPQTYHSAVGMRAEQDGGSVTIEGHCYRLIPYGSEQIDGVDPFTRPCQLCRAKPGTNHDEDCLMGPGDPHDRPQRCRDCGVGIGSMHAPDCIIEQCPHCGGQYVSCSCNCSEDRP